VVWNSETTRVPAAWGPSAGTTVLLEREYRREASSPKHLLTEDSIKEGRASWLVLSMLETFEGKEAREIYYVGL
jgi:hypothetical protein